MSKRSLRRGERDGNTNSPPRFTSYSIDDETNSPVASSESIRNNSSDTRSKKRSLRNRNNGDDGLKVSTARYHDGNGYQEGNSYITPTPSGNVNQHSSNGSHYYRYPRSAYDGDNSPLSASAEIPHVLLFPNLSSSFSKPIPMSSNNHGGNSSNSSTEEEDDLEEPLVEGVAPTGWRYYFSKSFVQWLAEVKVEKYGKRRLFVSFCFYLLCGAIAIFSTNVADFRRAELVDKGLLGVKLPDIGHSIVPLVTIKQFPDYFIVPAFVLTLGYFGVHRHRMGVLRRFFYCHGVLLLFRCLTIISTTLPDPNPACQYDPRKTNKHLFQSFNVLASETCGDLMFSGHTVALVIMGMIWTDYGPNIPKLRWFVWAFVVCGVVSLLAARYHYTIDLIIAWYLTYKTWVMYGWLIKHRHLRKTNPIISYLERRTSEHDFTKVATQLQSVMDKFQK